MKSKTTFLLALSFFLVLFSSCGEVPNAGEKEAWEDSDEYAAALAHQGKISAFVTAKFETIPMPRAASDDAADDPAIWLHPADPSKSLIFGTDKLGGLGAYNLQGELQNYYEIGKLNNVDIRYGFILGDRSVDILAASNQSINGISLYLIEPSSGKLEAIDGGSLVIDTAIIDAVYGFCLYRHLETNRYFAFVNGRNGLVQQYQIMEGTDGNSLVIELARTFELSSKVEGMVADDELGVLYVGEEGKGIWRFPANPEDPANGSIIPFSGMDNPELRYDLEGLALYKGSLGKGYLIVSSQGSFSYAVFAREGANQYYGSFKIAAGEDCDGVEETDGLEVINLPLGAHFPAGMLVVQDGFNMQGDSLVPQNFKLIPWERVNEALNLPLGMDTTYAGWMGKY